MRPTLPMIALLVVGMLGAVVFAQKESKPATPSSPPTSPPSSPPTLPDLKPSKDWRETKLKVPDSIEARAWSDPAAGCHLALFALAIPDTAADAKIVESLSAVLAKSDYRLTKLDSEQGPNRFDLEGFGVTGMATLDIPQGQGRKTTLLACYWNDREPAHCRTMCNAAVQTMSGSSKVQSQP